MLFDYNHELVPMSSLVKINTKIFLLEPSAYYQ